MTLQTSRLSVKAPYSHAINLCWQPDQECLFAALFKTKMYETQVNKLIINDVTTATMQQFLQFVYSEKVSGNFPAPEVFLDVIILLQKYLIQPTEERSFMLCKLVTAGISLDNVCSVASKALTYNFACFQTRVTNFLTDG